MFSPVGLHVFSARADNETIVFSGYTWDVKNADAPTGPGPNYWSNNVENVWVDQNGWLHLKITFTGGKWRCAEVSTTQPLEYGTYVFCTASRVDNFDKNVVLGLFGYKDDDHEVDIEFSRWGNINTKNAWFTVQPPPFVEGYNHKAFNIELTGDYSTHFFSWSRNNVFFESFHGHYPLESIPPSNVIQSWQCPLSPDAAGAEAHINLWLFQGSPPSDGQEVEVVIKEFKFYAAPQIALVRGMDDRIYYRVWNAAGWEDWTAFPGSTIDTPAAAMLGNELHIVVRGSDGYSLWYGNLTDPANLTTFSSWTLLDGATSSAPTLTSNGTTLCLVVRGLDDRIYYRSYTSSWGPWQAVPTGATPDGPAAAMLGNDLHIVVRGMDGSSLWDTIVSCNGTVIRGWSLLSGATPSKPVLACSGSDNLCLVARGIDNAIYYRSYTNSTDSWASWSALPTGATIDGPAATVTGNELCTVVRGLDGNSLWSGDIDLGTSSFLGWTLLSGATPSAPTLTS